MAGSVVPGGLPLTRRRLCLFTASPEPSGVGSHMLTLARGLADDYHVTMVASPTGGLPLLGRAKRAGIAVRALASETPADREALSGWLVRSGIELFHDHAGIGWEGLDAIGAAHAAEIPVVIRTEHLPYLLTDEGQVARHRRMLGMIHALLTVSRGAAASMVQAGVPAALIHVVRNGIAVDGDERAVSGATSRAVRSRIRTGIGIPADAPLIVNVGRLTPQKAQDVLIDALPMLPDLEADPWLAIVGVGPAAPALAERARALGVDGRVRLIGGLEDVSGLLGAADLFVLPSRFEGLPLVALEAMAARLPVIATRVVGCEEAVQDGRTGLLVPVDDALALARAIGTVLCRPELARRLGDAGHASVRRDFTAERMVAETAAIYERMLARWDARRMRARRIAPLEEAPGH